MAQVGATGRERIESSGVLRLYPRVDDSGAVRGNRLLHAPAVGVLVIERAVMREGQLRVQELLADRPFGRTLTAQVVLLRRLRLAEPIRIRIGARPPGPIVAVPDHRQANSIALVPDCGQARPPR